MEAELEALLRPGDVILNTDGMSVVYEVRAPDTMGKGKGEGKGEFGGKGKGGL